MLADWIFRERHPRTTCDRGGPPGAFLLVIVVYQDRKRIFSGNSRVSPGHACLRPTTAKTFLILSTTKFKPGNACLSFVGLRFPREIALKFLFSGRMHGFHYLCCQIIYCTGYTSSAPRDLQSICLAVIFRRYVHVRVLAKAGWQYKLSFNSLVIHHLCTCQVALM